MLHVAMTSAPVERMSWMITSPMQTGAVACALLMISIAGMIMDFGIGEERRTLTVSETPPSTLTVVAKLRFGHSISSRAHASPRRQSPPVTETMDPFSMTASSWHPFGHMMHVRFLVI